MSSYPIRNVFRGRVTKSCRQSISSNATLNLLRRFDPMASFDWAGLSSIARQAQEFRLPANRVLVRHPRRLSGVCYLVSGTLIDVETGERLQAGSHRCRWAVYPGHRSLRALTPVQMLFFDKDAAVFLADVAGGGVVGGNVVGGDVVGGDVVGGDVAGTKAVSGIGGIAGAIEPAGQPQSKEFFHCTSDPNDWLVTLAASSLLRFLYHRRGAAGWQTWLQNFDALPVATNEFLIRRGGVGDFFYIVQSGFAVVHTDQGPRRIAEGGFFGEDALLSHQRRNACVVMPAGGRVLRGNAELLLSLVDDLWWVLARDAGSWKGSGEMLSLPEGLITETLREWLLQLPKEKDYVLSLGSQRVMQDLLLLLLVHRGYSVLLDDR